MHYPLLPGEVQQSTSITKELLPTRLLQRCGTRGTGVLNPIRYQIKKHIVTTVDKYGHARLREDIHYYSVLHTYIGKKVHLHYTATYVEIDLPEETAAIPKRENIRGREYYK